MVVIRDSISESSDEKFAGDGAGIYIDWGRGRGYILIGVEYGYIYGLDERAGVYIDRGRRWAYILIEGESEYIF